MATRDGECSGVHRRFGVLLCVSAAAVSAAVVRCEVRIDKVYQQSWQRLCLMALVYGNTTHDYCKRVLAPIPCGKYASKPNSNRLEPTPVVRQYIDTPVRVRWGSPPGIEFPPPHSVFGLQA